MCHIFIAALITGAVIFSAVKPVLGHSSANLKYSCNKQKFSHFPHVLAIGITIYAIDEIKTGAISLLTGICCMAFFWVVAFILDSIWIVGYVIGEFLINIGATLTDLALELLKL